MTERLSRHLPVWLIPAGALGVLIAFTIIYEIVAKGQSTFIKPENLFNMARQWSDRGIIALGMTLVITLGGIDLSVGSLTAFLGGMGILLMNRMIAGNSYESIAVVAAGLWMLVAGSLAGFINGILVTRGRIASFIVTLAGLGVYRSLAQWPVDGGEYRSASPHWFAVLGSGGIPIPGTNIAPRSPVPVPLLLPWPVLIFILLIFIAWALLNRSQLGRYITAVGANEKAASYAGINTEGVKLITFSLLGLFTGITALLLSSRLNSISSLQSGQLYELDVIAAVVIGGTRLRGGSGTIMGTVIGVMILAVIGNMLNLLQVSVYLQGLVKGLIIIGAVLLQRAERD